MLGYPELSDGVEELRSSFSKRYLPFKRSFVQESQNLEAVKYTYMKKNKLGVENSLVNNINAKKKAGTSKPKKESTISKEDYKKLKKGWK